MVAQARALGVREAGVVLRDAFERNDLLTYASAISFKLFFALIPLALFGLGLLGGSGLEGVWASDLAPRLREAVSAPAFRVIDDTVREVLSQRQLFWVTAGAALAIWEVSGAVRAVMGVLDRIYDVTEQRGFVRRMAVSIGLGTAIIVLLLATAATLQVVPRLIHEGVLGVAVGIVRWPVALLLLWVTVTLVVGLAPAEERPAERVTFGSSLVTVAWLGSSAVFAWYLTNVASYGSIFGALATIVVVLTYLYISSIVFVTGVQLDALVHARQDDARS
jgi:membrane protein